MAQAFRIRLRSAGAAEILIYEDIGESFFFGGVTAKMIADELKKLGKIDHIDVRINSYGGDVFEGLAIYRQLVDHGAKIVVHIDGIAASIASVIAMAGKEIRIAEAAQIMVHNAWGVMGGDAQGHQDFAVRLETVSAAIADVYQARTSLPLQKIRDYMTAETWFTSAEALAAGFATSVVENLKIAAAAAPKFDGRKYPYRATPAPKVVPLSRPTIDAGRARFDEQRARTVQIAARRMPRQA